MSKIIQDIGSPSIEEILQEKKQFTDYLTGESVT